MTGYFQGSSHKVIFFHVYGPHEDSACITLWQDLLEVLSATVGYCCLMGDFNVVRREDERKCSHFYQRRAAKFNEFINAAGLLELQMGGRKFTSIGMGGSKLSKLDRFLVFSDLLNVWPPVSVVALERTYVDHCLALLKTATTDFGPSPFCFFDHWMQDESFSDMVKLSWASFPGIGSPMDALKDKLKLLKAAIKSWRSAPHQSNILAARRNMEQWELRAEAEVFGPEESDAFIQARSNYFAAEKMHSLSIRQKSRVKWAVDGDEIAIFSIPSCVDV